jgi:ketosteroid isomerase-like protein
MFAARTLSVVALTCLTLSACESKAGNTAALTDADRNSMKTSVANFDKAMLAADWPTVVAAYTEDAVLFPPNAPIVKGRAAIQKFFEGFPKITEFKQSVVEIEGLGDLAYPWGTYQMAMLPPSSKTPVKDQGKVLSVWRKQADGSWLASRVAWNSDLAPAR